MRLIVITEPHFAGNEAAVATSLFRSGLQTLHVRKPEANDESVARLLDAIPADFHPRIMLHQSHALSTSYDIKVRESEGRGKREDMLMLAAGRLHASCRAFTTLGRTAHGLRYR